MSTIGEERSGLLNVQPEIVGPATRRLGNRSSRILDSLLGSPGLYHPPSVPERIVEIGDYMNVMEIVSPAGRRVFRWTGHLGGLGGEVADLVMGRGD